MQKKSLRQAAREYGVPATTLKRRIDTSLPAEAKPGPQTVLSKVEEERLVSYIITMAQIGFGLSPHDIRSLAYELLKIQDIIILSLMGLQERIGSKHSHADIRSP